MSGNSFEYKAGSMSSVVNGKSGVLNLDEAQGMVECFVSGIGNKDSVGDIVHSGAFTKSLMRRKPRVVWGHNWNDPIGKVLEIYEVPPTDPRLPMKMKMAGIGGLFARVQFNLNSEKGKEAFANVAFFGEDQEWSIGYKTLRAQFDQKSQANMIYELELYEVSPVLHGANQLTGTISVKAGMPGTYAMEGTTETVGQERPAMSDELEEELQKVLGNQVSVTEVDEENGMVSFSKGSQSDPTEKYKCNFSRGGHGRFMFSAPERIVVIAKPSATTPMMPIGGLPPVDPQRVVRPSQMPSIPVAVKPGPDGMTIVPLPAMQYEGQMRKPISAEDLDQEESDLRDALLKIVKRHGKINEDSDGIWAGYRSAAENTVAGIGVKCSNCVFYNKDNSCQIVDMDIEPEGKCRFAVIPPGVVKGDFTAKKEYEFETEDNENEYISEFEFKYPGELFVAGLRGAVTRKRRKKRKFKHLSEFGTYEDSFDPEKPYFLPVSTDYAFRVKQALDPVFDYHKVDTYVDPEGIVITNGVSYELIDAIDTALDNFKKKSLITDDLELKVSSYRLGRAIGNRVDNRPGIGGARSAGRFFSTPNAERFDPRTAIDRNLNGVVGEGIFLRGTSLEQPDPTPNGPGSINNPKMPGEAQAPKTPSPISAEVQPSSDVTPPTELIKPKKQIDKAVSEARKLAQAKNKDYLDFLRKRESDRTLAERIKFDGVFNVITSDGKFSSGADDLNSLKPGDIVDTATLEGRAVVDEYYAQLGKQIIEMLQDAINNPGKFKWNLPWREGEHNPRNPTKKNKAQKNWSYQGTNRSLLNSIAVAREYETNKWAGMSQWKKFKGKPSPNARPVNILVPILGSEPRQYKVEEVYNVADIDGLPPEMYKPEIDLENLSPKARVKNAEEIVKELAPRIRESNVGGAFFSPAGDFINMPQFETFNSAEGYYATLLHEMTHWTGHPSRNDRPQISKHGSPGYAFEELIAEIGSSFLLGMIGISPMIREDHIAYLQGWLTKIKKDPNAVKNAMGQAQQAVDWMLNRSKTLRRLSGMEDNERKAKTSSRDSVPLSMLEGYEDVPSIPVGKPITGPMEDIDLIDRAETTDNRFLSGIPFLDKEDDVTDTSDLSSSSDRKKYGSQSKEERMYGDIPSVFDDKGRALTLDGRFASGGESIKPRAGSSRKPVRRTAASVDVKSLLNLLVPPTDEQRDIIDLGLAAVYGKEKLVIGVDAAAGSGKTTTMKMLASAVNSEFSVDDIMQRYAGDEVTRKQQLLKKANYLAAKYPQKGYEDVDAFFPENTDEKTLIEAIRALGESRGVTESNKPTIYYTVFGKENRLEAAESFPGNTGIGTTTQLAYWSLRQGIAENDSPENYIINASSMKRKIELITEYGRRRSLGDKTKVVTVKGYDEANREHDSKDMQFTGYKPNYEDLGYRTVSDGKSFLSFLAAKGIKIPSRTASVATGKGKKAKTRNVEVYDVPFTMPDGNNWIELDLFGEYLAMAFRRWTLSADPEVTKDVFKLSLRELTDTMTGRFRSKKSKQKTVSIDEQIDGAPDELMDEWLSYIKIATDELIDGNGMLLPTQGQLPKLLLLADPDLSTNPGALGHGSKDSLDNEKIPSQFKLGKGDVVYYGKNNKFYDEVIDEKTGKILSLKLWEKSEGEPWVIVSVDGSRGKLKKQYASKEKPISLFAIDEAQDLNEVWEEIMNRNKERVSVIAVGDDRQQILGFNGSKNIMQAISPDFSPKLTQSFRFGSLLGYMATLILGEQNQVLQDISNPDQPLTPEQWKYVEGAADTAALRHIENIFTFVQAGDFGAANSVNDTVKRLYGVSFDQYLNGENFARMTKTGRSKALTDLRKEIDKAKTEIANALRTRVVDEKEEIFFGALPDMALSRGKVQTVHVAVKTWRDLFVESAVFLDGVVDNPDLLRNSPDMTQEQFDDLVRPLTSKDKPQISLTQSAWQEAIDFFLHIDWAEKTARGLNPGRKPAASSLIGDYWDLAAIKARFKLKSKSPGNSLYQLLFTPDPGQTATGLQTMYASEMLVSLRGGQVTLADGTKSYRSSDVRPMRDSLDLGLMEFEEKTLTEILSSTDKSFKATDTNAVSKISIVSPVAGGTQDAVYFQIEYDFANGQDDINLDDFEVITERIPGQAGDRVRVVSKWLNSSGQPKFETVAEFGEAGTVDGLKETAFQRMRHKLVVSATAGRSNTGTNPRETFYAKKQFRWTGRLILTGDGVDTGRPQAVFADPDKYPDTRGRNFDGAYLSDTLRVLDRLGLQSRARLTYGVGTKRSTSKGRDYDGFVIDAKDDPEEATRIINLVGDAIRKSAKKRGGNVVIQTGTTAKGKEGKFVLVLDDFTNPDDDLNADILGAAAQNETGPPGWMEEMNLQHVVVTRAMKGISIPPRMWMTHFADGEKRKRIADLIRDGVERGILPKDFDREAELSLDKLPAVYRNIEEYAAEGKDLTEFNGQRGNILSLADEDLLAETRRIGVPDIATQGFIRRRKEVMDEFSDSGLPEDVLRAEAIKKMKERAYEVIDGPMFNPAAQGSEQEEQEELDIDNLVEDDADNVLDELDEISTTTVEEEEAEEADEADEPDAGFSSGAEPEGASDEVADGAARQVRSSRISGTPEGRFGRRLNRFENRAGMQQRLSALELAGIRTDVRIDPQDRDRVTRYAMQFWDGFNQTGIAIDMPADQADQSTEQRARKINENIRAVGERMKARRRSDGSRVVQIGKTTDNLVNNNPSGESWMLPVEKLLDTIRIPTRWRKQEDISRGTITSELEGEGIVDVATPAVGVYWTQSVPLSVPKLAKLLGLNVTEESKLKGKDAAITHDTVRYLLAEIGRQPEFSGWRLFSPVSDMEAKDEGMTMAERLVENIGRANMRDRFIIETFGADAYPYWHDRGDFMGGVAEEEVYGSKNMLTAEEFSKLDDDGVRRFNAVGKFENAPSARDDSEAEVELSYEGTMGENFEALPPDMADSARRGKESRSQRRDFTLVQLLDHLGIPDDRGWEKQLKPVLEAAFGEDVDVGLGPDAIKAWEKDGVPIAYIAEMIRTGIIPNANEVFGVNKAGKKLDEELLASKANVYEALTEFIDRSFPDSSLNSPKSRNFIINSTEMGTVLQNAAKAKGKSFSKKLGDVPRFSKSELQEFVDQFNKTFGTNHTIEDIFSAEQLRNAQDRLREGQTMYKPSKSGRKGTRKVSPEIINR